MSASIDSSAIFMKDTANQIKTKVNKYAFSGGQVTVEEQREKGGDTDKDVSYQYLGFFMEDDAELARIGEEYRSGKLLTGELKSICIQHLQEYVQGFQERRAKVTEEIIDEFMARRPLRWTGNPKAPVVVPVVENGAADGAGGEGGDGKVSKNQLKKLEKLKAIAEKKERQAQEKAAAKEAS